MYSTLEICNVRAKRNELNKKKYVQAYAQAIQSVWHSLKPTLTHTQAEKTGQITYVGRWLTAVQKEYKHKNKRIVCAMGAEGQRRGNCVQRYRLIICLVSLISFGKSCSPYKIQCAAINSENEKQMRAHTLAGRTNERESNKKPKGNQRNEIRL